MAVSSRPDHFFQTTASLDEVTRKAEKSKNKSGSPVQLSSKVLAVAADPHDEDTVWIAESAALVKSISLSSGVVTRTLSGPTAPLTSLAFSVDPHLGRSVIAGCWDKTAWQFDLGSGGDRGTKAAATQYSGNNDFLKCVLIVPIPSSAPLLVTGSADGEVMIFSTASPRQRLHTLKPQSRGVEDLAMDPFSDRTSPTVFLATSQREIYHFTLPVSAISPPTSASLKLTALSAPILAHETSVYKLHFDGDGDMWTASADKTAKHLVRDGDWRADTSLAHPDFVRDVAVHERGGWVATACRDEAVRLWDRASGALHHVFAGHFEEVTGLCLVGGDTLVSVGIDATLRRWSLKPAELKRAVQDAASAAGGEKGKEDGEETVKDGDDLGLTEEEERELREMMENEEHELQDLMADDLQ